MISFCIIKQKKKTEGIENVQLSKKIKTPNRGQASEEVSCAGLQVVDVGGRSEVDVLNRRRTLQSWVVLLFGSRDNIPKSSKMYDR